ncbi:L-aminoadipate-semialdehyde dehydrogenase-phosphopantetheinyl transferase-like [Oppia nitens]|uniref:L-aminoadipate-semialdehyde dehydrogenase-phosphopantetheinyl transferase-like n=1 Tax=Oppia nitens TaxID=1686743 RepID=UPI0023DCB17F|nr:L-aminoadipate-semialdehyde dehydrogenase-phosphopantetheinyl transferase-like [Oppia nitens]
MRWFVNVSKWIPTQEEWLRAVRSVQSEELSRINQFVFRSDAMLSLVGRLLMRCCVHKCLKPSIEFQDIRFGRTTSGKPFVVSPVLDGNDDNNRPHFDLNVSHSGNYCVLASVDGSQRVGVDVMKIEYSGQRSGRPIDDFFRIMNRQFSGSEWQFINSCLSDDRQRLSRFIRLWTLKEAFVKADGQGIAFNLKRISFDCRTPELSSDSVTVDTVVRVDDQLLDNWIFEESLLDSDHCVCVAYDNFKTTSNTLKTNYQLFEEKSITNLLEEAVPLNNDDNDNNDISLWLDFEKKLIKKQL